MGHPSLYLSRIYWFTYELMLRAVTFCLSSTQWRVVGMAPPRPRTPARRPSPSSEDLPSFFHARPDISNRDKRGFSCIQLKKGSRRCTNVISGKRESAYNVRRALLISNPAGSEFIALMVAYVKLCSCHSHNEPARVGRLAERWATHLRRLHDLHWDVLTIDTPYAMLAYVSSQPSSSGLLTPPDSRSGSEHLHQNLYLNNDLAGSGVFRTPGAFPASNYDFQSTIDAHVQLLRHKFDAIPEGLQEKYYEFSKLEAPVRPMPEPETPNLQPKTDHPHIFVPLPAPRGLSLYTVAQGHLFPAEADSGYIYVYTKEEDPGYVKIGYTKQRAETRLGQWSCTCGQHAIEAYVSDWMPHAKRIERLITVELQLAGSRVEEKNCRGCCKNHKEWFSISVSRAKEVVDHWTTWMKKFQPYGEDGLPTAAATEAIFLGATDKMSDVEGFLRDSTGQSWRKGLSEDSVTTPKPKRPCPVTTMSAPPKMQTETGSSDCLAEDLLKSLPHRDRAQSAQSTPTKSSRPKPHRQGRKLDGVTADDSLDISPPQETTSSTPMAQFPPPGAPVIIIRDYDSPDDLELRPKWVSGRKSSVKNTL